MKEEHDSFRYGKVHDKYFHLLISLGDIFTYYYPFSKIDSKSLFLGHLSDCGLGENLVYDTSTFGDVQHMC